MSSSPLVIHGSGPTLRDVLLSGDKALIALAARSIRQRLGLKRHEAPQKPMTKTAEDVLNEARADIRTAINNALVKIKAETHFNPSEVSIYVDMVSTGPQFDREPEYALGQVDVKFKV